MGPSWFHALTLGKGRKLEAIVTAPQPSPETEPEPETLPTVIPDEPEPQTAPENYDDIPAFLLDPEPLSVKEIPDDRKAVTMAEPLPVTQPNLNDSHPVGFQPVAVPYETISLIAEMRLSGSTLSQIAQRTKLGPCVLRRIINTLKATGSIPAPVVRRGAQRTEKPEAIIEAIRRLRSDGKTMSDIHRDLGISRRVVSRIVHVIEPDWNPPHASCHGSRQIDALRRIVPTRNHS